MDVSRRYIHINELYFSPTELNERKSCNRICFATEQNTEGVDYGKAPVSLSHWHTYINLISAWTHAVSEFDWKQRQSGKLKM